MPRFAAATGASPSLRVGRTNRRVTGGHRWMIVTATPVAAQNSAYRLTRRYSSSGRKTPPARQVPHTGRAISRSPRGIEASRFG